jgi:hypothetical protein
MPRYANELTFALLAIVVITALYAVVAWDGAPGPGTFIGHGLGIVGFLLMLATETVYTLRKRLRGFQYGQTGIWLRVHIFTGIVGPYLVLLHSAGKFNGLAGVLTFVTLLVVLSGFVGRYIYTATPRDMDGAEADILELQREISETDARLQAVGGKLGEVARRIVETEQVGAGWFVVLARGYLRWRERRRVQAELASLQGEDRDKVEALAGLLEDHYRLLLQAHSIVAMRRMLAWWHLFHVPMGAVLFTLAFIHVFAAVYYSTLLR